MILKIKSNNDHLLDILFKNPETDRGMYFKPLKNGQVVGNAIDKHHYEVVFQDTRYSYMAEDANQMDYPSYCSPLVVLHICNELFIHILKSKEEYLCREITWLHTTQGKVDTESCTIEVPSFYIDSTWYRKGKFLLTRYFDGITIRQQSSHIFSLTVTAKSVFEAFNLLALTSLLAHVTNENSINTYIDDGLAQKYGRILTNIDNVPYFVFYLFILRAVKSPRQFEELKPVFETYLAQYGLQVDFVLQGTSRQRLDYITGLLEMDIPVLDIGCGEFQYYKKVMQKGFTAGYHAVDKEPRFEHLAVAIGRRYEEDNLNFYPSVEDYRSDEKVNIILTEVIEHNPFEDAVELIKKALTYNFNKIIITTPNIEFNQFYVMESGKRHADHHFEPTAAEFKALIEKTIDGIPVQVEYFQLGDNVNGIQPTQGCVITK